jgi:hypothetical protein
LTFKITQAVGKSTAVNRHVGRYSQKLEVHLRMECLKAQPRLVLADLIPIKYVIRGKVVEQAKLEETIGQTTLSTPKRS